MNTIGEGGIQSLSRGYEYLSDIMEAMVYLNFMVVLKNIYMI